ncbi:MAG: hypothetical protein ACLSTV_10480 [Coriobacteriales bacterium]|nr:hypothetical protein [Clostridia bacterium]
MPGKTFPSIRPGIVWNIRYSVTGKDVPPSLSGAVGLSACSTLEEIMTR